jgi:hypothetical protein
VIKERARAIIQTLPYRLIPKKVRIGLIQYVIFWLNNIPKAGQQHSPRDLIFGEQKMDYNLMCHLPFGAYVQVHDDLDITNTMQARTTGAINLGVTGNIQGTHRFYSLRTGEIIVRRNWTELPTPNEVIDRLEEMTIAEVEAGNEHEIYQVDDENHDSEEEKLNEQVDEMKQEGVETDYDKENEINHNDNNNEEENIVDENIENKAETNNEGHYNLRPNRMRNYLNQYTFVSVKAGLNKWGDKARKAVLEELMMFLKLKVFDFIPNPTQEQMKKALRVHCFLTEKRDGWIKARAVADGRSQIQYKEEETYSPTVKLESIM